MSRGRALLIAQLPGPPLDPPPEWLTSEQVRAWNEVVAAAPGDVFRLSDTMFMECVACCLSQWRAGFLGPEWVRELYRMLGKCFIPMRERRRLLFPERPRRK